MPERWGGLLINQPAAATGAALLGALGTSDGDLKCDRCLKSCAVAIKALGGNSDTHKRHHFDHLKQTFLVEAALLYFEVLMAIRLSCTLISGGCRCVSGWCSHHGGGMADSFSLTSAGMVS